MGWTREAVSRIGRRDGEQKVSDVRGRAVEEGRATQSMWLAIHVPGQRRASMPKSVLPSRMALRA